MSAGLPFPMQLPRTCAALREHGLNPEDVLQNSLHAEGYIAPLRDVRGNRKYNTRTNQLRVESRSWPSKSAGEAIIEVFLSEGGSLA